MASIVVTGVGMGHIIISELQQSILIDHAIIAYYAAESALESSLYQIRSLETPLTSLPLSGTLDNGATWELDWSYEQTDINTNIPENTTYQLDLFDPDDLSWFPNIEALRFVWEGSGKLEIAYISWVPGASITWPQEDYYAESPISFVSPAIVYTALDDLHAYRIRLKAVDGDIDNLNITGWSDDGLLPGTQQPLPSHITLNARGSYGKSRQAISATTPRFNQLSGIFDFVLFSEQQVTKE
jgi:hypothetical protein